MIRYLLESNIGVPRRQVFISNDGHFQNVLQGVYLTCTSYVKRVV